MAAEVAAAEAVVGEEAPEDMAAAVAAVGHMEVAVAEGTAVGGEVVVEGEEAMAAVAEAAGEVAGAGEDAMATGFALTRAVVT